jgi:type II secretory pathway component GspD/PulD (secretin)
MKRLMVVLSFLVSLGVAQLAPLPDDARFDAPTTFVTESGGESLRAMIDALARTAGLTPIVDNVPETVITYNIDGAIPFRQVWSIVLTQHNLSYVLLENDVVVVGPSSAIAALQTPGMAETQQGEPIVSRFYRVANEPSDVATIVRQAVPGVEVSVLESVRSIAVRGTAAQQAEVQNVLSQFDQVGTVAPSVIRVYRLSNSNAGTLATILQGSGVEMIAADDNGEENGLASAPLFTVVADERTNTLLVTAPVAIQEQIAALIPELDVPQQQINVQVRIQEVTTTAVQNLGINLRGGLGNFAVNFLEGALNFIFDAQNAVSGLNIGAVLDTLERQGLARRVDDTTLTISNNGTGSILAGGTIFVLLPSASENIEREIEYGVQIDVSPRINNEGLIILDVSARIDDPISELTNPNFFEISTRRINSVVTLSPGQTILLGGVFQNSFNSTSEGVPFLSSIPIIGGAFSRNVNNLSNTEILLVITADILD